MQTRQIFGAACESEAAGEVQRQIFGACESEAAVGMSRMSFILDA